MAAQDLNNTFDLTGAVDAFLSSDELKGLANTTLSDFADLGLDTSAADALLSANNHEEVAQMAQQGAAQIQEQSQGEDIFSWLGSFFGGF